ncbi:MAG: leucyl aminopeptidase [Deltaproteobacteria bacterium]|nr:MAG: leucyl aminopeptidase [Deltaproteobacteria bacterium]
MSKLPNVKLSSGALNKHKADLFVLPVYEGEVGSKRKSLRPLVTRVRRALRGVLEEAAKSERFSGKAGQMLALHTHGRLGAPRLTVVGLGKSGSTETHSTLRNAVGAAVRGARRIGATRVLVLLPEDARDAEAVRAATEGAILGAYRFDRYLTQEQKGAGKPVRTVALLVEDARDAAAKQALGLGQAIAEAANLARDLVNEPAGVIYPATLADFARDLAKAHGLKSTVRGLRELEKLGFGMMVGVGQGSDHEPKFITLEYRPGGRSSGKGIAFVGKGVTFDAGGYDIKPAASMLDMKMDMAGAAAAICAMRAIAALEPPFPVTAYVGAVENLVSGRAYKPGDILKSRKGLTVEVNNTDAEGRLVLGDVLSYAVEQGHEAIVDLATLTGACMVALGPYTAGVFSNDEATAKAVLDAGRKAGEDLWQLPLNEDLGEQLDSDIADTKNTGERWGGAITAALFLSKFTEHTPWVHLDIAGPAMLARERGPFTKGATGVGVRTLAQWTLDRMRAA